MITEEKKKQFQEHKALPFPSMEDLDLCAEFAMLDADVVGEIQGMVNGAQSEFQHSESYRQTIAEIKAEAKQKNLEDVITYLDSLSKLLD